MKTWRERFAPAIAKIISSHKGQTEAAVRKALRQWWSNQLLGPRTNWPYKVFLREIRRQLGKQKRKVGVYNHPLFENNA